VNPYDPGARCPKCGNDGVSTEYRSGWLPGFMGGPAWKFSAPFLARKCQRCSYYWEEAPVDEEAPAA